MNKKSTHRKHVALIISALINISVFAADYTDTITILQQSTETYNPGDRFLMNGKNAFYFAYSGSDSITVNLNSAEMYAKYGFMVGASHSRDYISSSAITITGGQYSIDESVFRISGSYGHHNSTISISGGAIVKSASWNLIEASCNDNPVYTRFSVGLSISGEGTLVEGNTFTGAPSLSIVVSDGGLWRFKGSNSLTSLTVNGGTAEFIKTAASDALTLTGGALNASNGGKLYISFTDEFIEEIVQEGYYKEYLSDTVVGSYVQSSNYHVATSNDHYEWNVVYGSGYFEITDITAVVPESSIYAAVFGIMVLGFASYRRRTAPLKK